MGAAPSLESETQEATKIITAITKSFCTNYAQLYAVAASKEAQERLQRDKRKQLLKKCETSASHPPIRKKGLLLKECGSLVGTKWALRFVVVQGDWIVAYYPPEAASRPGTLPRKKLNLSGYNVVRDPNAAAHDRAAAMAGAMGLPTSHVPLLAALPQFTLELFNKHNLDTKRFQCVDAVEFEAWANVFDSAHRNAPSLNITDDSVHAVVFPAALKRIQEFSSLHAGWKGAGGEVESISACVLDSLDDVVMPRVDGKLTMSFTARAKIRSAFQEGLRQAVTEAVGPAWSAAYAAVSGLRPGMEKALTPLIGPVTFVQQEIEGAIHSVVNKTANTVFNETLVPHLGPLADKLYGPVEESFALVQVAFDDAVMKSRPLGTTVHMVQTWGWSDAFMKAEGMSTHLHAPLLVLSDAIGGVDVDKCTAGLRRCLRETMDDALCTFESLHASGVPWDAAKEQTTRMMAHDCRLGFEHSFVSVLETAVDAPWRSNVVEPCRVMVRLLAGTIPDDMRRFVDINDILQSVLQRHLRFGCWTLFEVPPLDKKSTQQISYPVKYAITIVRAKGLLNRDSGMGGSDPYVKMFQNKEQRHQTPAVQDNLNPVWESTGMVTVTSVHDSILSFTVWDEDTMSDEFLGTADLKTVGLKEHGTVDLTLNQRPGETDEEILEAKGNLGTLVVSWKCSRTYAITVVRAKGLLNRDSGMGGSDPYVKMFQNKEQRHQTPAVQDNLNPVWESTGMVTVTSVHDSILSFTVWDEDTMSDEFLGAADLNTVGLKEHGTVELTLYQRPGETDEEILEAKGNLGTLVVSWKSSAPTVKDDDNVTPHEVVLSHVDPSKPFWASRLLEFYKIHNPSLATAAYVESVLVTYQARGYPKMWELLKEKYRAKDIDVVAELPPKAQPISTTLPNNWDVGEWCQTEVKRTPTITATKRVAAPVVVDRAMLQDGTVPSSPRPNRPPPAIPPSAVGNYNLHNFETYTSWGDLVNKQWGQRYSAAQQHAPREWRTVTPSIRTVPVPTPPATPPAPPIPAPLKPPPEYPTDDRASRLLQSIRNPSVKASSVYRGLVPREAHSSALPPTSWGQKMGPAWTPYL